MLDTPGFLDNAKATVLSSNTFDFNSTGFWISDPSVDDTSTTILLNNSNSLMLTLRVVISDSVVEKAGG